MIRSRARGLYNAHVIALCLVLTGAFWAYLLSLNAFYPGADDLQLDRYIYYNAIGVIGLLLTLLRGDERDLGLFGNDPFHAIREASQQVLYVTGALTFTLLITKDRGISRFFLFTYLPLLWILLGVANAALPRYLSRIFFRGTRLSNALLVGPESRVAGIRRWMRYMEAFGVNVVGLLSDDNRQPAVFGVPVIGQTSDLRKTLESRSIQSIILLDIPSSDRLLREAIDLSDAFGARLVTLNNLDEKFRHSVQYIEQFGLNFITIREEPLEDPTARILKRTADILVCLPIVLCVIPLLSVLVAVVHRLQSSGPLFYRQLRSGAQGRPFEILKFRTMHATDFDAAQQATANDARIFPLGSLLRKTSLDEFPQFINVLKGDMSIVGPRPHMIEHDAQFTAIMASYPVRSLVKPGLTGLAQVRGFRGEAKTNDDIRKRVQCDIEYIENWSLLLDLYIVLRTAWQVLRPPKSAY